MKKIIVLLIAVCCLLVSCQKEDGSGSGANNVDGSTWVWSDNSAETIVLKGGFASYYYNNKLRDTQSYSVKGNELIFSEPLHRESGENDIYYDSGSFNKDYSKLTISGRKTDVNSPGVQDFKRTFNRVAE